MAKIVLNIDLQANSATMELNKTDDQSSASAQKILEALQSVDPIKLLLNFNKLQESMSGLLTGIKNLGEGLASLPTLLTTVKTGFNAIGSAAAGAKTAANAASAAMATATLGASFVISAISWIVDAVQTANQKAEEARQAAIETGIAAKDEAKTLLTLRDDMRNAVVGTEEFTAASAALAQELGLTADAFEKSGLSADEYAAKLENLTEIELRRKLSEAKAGVDAAEEGVEDTGGNEHSIEKYEDFLTTIDALTVKQTNALLNGNEDLAFLYQKRIDELKEYVNSEEGQAVAKLIEAQDSYEKLIKILEGIVNGTDEATENTAAWKTNLESVKTQFSDILNDTEEVNELTEYQNKVLEAQKSLTEAISQARKDYLNSVLDEYLEGLEDETKYEEYLLKIEEERRDLVIERVQAYIDGLEEETTLQERLLAVEEAREALENAKNQRTVRVFNAETGNWEWQADRHEVEDAQNSLDEAEASLDEYLKSQAWQEIQNSIRDGSANEGTIRQILDKWLSLSGSGELSSWGDGLVHEINDATKDAADATTSSVDALTEYLKDEAVAEIRELIDSGNATSGGIKSILDTYLQKSGDEALFEWADNLNTAMSDAIESDYFDRSKVEPQFQDLNTAQENLQAYLAMKVLDEIMKAAGDGKPTQKMIDNAIKNSGLSPSMQNKVRELISGALANVPETQPEKGQNDNTGSPDTNPYDIRYDLTRYGGYASWANRINNLGKTWYDSFSGTLIGKWDFNPLTEFFTEKGSDGKSYRKNFLLDINEFKANSSVNKKYKNYEDYVTQTLTKYVESTNMAAELSGLDTLNMSAIEKMIEHLRENDWKWPVFDNGGILYGMGGIKATDSAEAVLGPELTKKMLEPVTTAQFREAVENLGFLFAHPREMATATDILKNVTFLNRGGGSSQNIGTQYTINGMQISKEVAENYTVAELLSNAAFLSNSN